MSPFLCKGITFAAFQAVGKVEESNERLITCVKAGSRLMAASLIICTSIMSRPVAFVGFKPCTTLTLFYAGGGIYAPPTTYRQFSPDVLIGGGSNYTLNSSFVIAEHMKLVPGQKNFPTARESPPKSAG